MNGRCECAAGRLGTNCSMEGKCTYWNEAAQAFTSDGLTAAPPPPGGFDGFLYCDATHLTDFGVLSIPTSFSDLLADLTSIQINIFTLDDLASALTSFNFAENPLIYLLLLAMTLVDVLSMLFLGFWRDHRKRIRRERLGRLYM